MTTRSNTFTPEKNTMTPIAPITRPGLSAAALIVAALGALHASTARAQQSSGSSACYVPGSGTVYVVKAASTPSDCRAGHVAFTLAPGTSSPQLAPPGGSALTKNSQGAYDLSNVDGLVSTGTWGSGNLPVAGAGTRLMWYPGKAAFRAGVVLGTQWDNASIGIGSAALGHNSTASGNYSLVAGTNSTASAGGAFAMGDHSEATGTNTVAAGYRNKATAANAVAMGDRSEASGTNAVALGSQNKATATGAVGLGRSSEATGDGSLAAGYASKASGLGSVALGYFSSASGPFSAAMADGAASGEYAIAMGFNTAASARSAIAVGGSATASGEGSLALGSNANTNGKEGAIVISDRSATAGYPVELMAQSDNQFVVRAQRIWLGRHSGVTSTAGRFIETTTGGYLSNGGAWVNSSDSTRKHRWEDVDGESVLTRIAGMPVRTWSYREEDDSVRHMGPTAQEFRAAFGLGDTDKAIATVDADGVSLAAIQALIQRTAELRRDNAELRASVESLRNELEHLRALLGARNREGR